MKDIYILDAVNYLYRSYYAIGPMTNPKGQSTSALYGFIRSVKKMIKDFQPSHLVCVFDGPQNIETRQKTYAAYKAHRTKAPDDFYPQIQWAVEYCQMAGIPFLMVKGYEADDTIASVCLWAKTKGVTTYICSSDKDLFQLIDENTFALNIHKDNVKIDIKEVEKKFGVHPKQMLDLLALMGDASDNIPGVEGIGPKTAQVLLQQYHTLDAVLENHEKIGGKKGKVLQAQKEQALLSKQLATLITDVSFPKEVSFFSLQPADISQLKEFYRKMHFLTFLNEFEEGKTLQKEKVSYTLITTIKQVKDLVQALLQEPILAIDTETTFDHPLLAKLVGIGLSNEPKKAYYIPFNGAIELEELTKALSPLLENTKTAFVGQNIKFDLHILHQHGLKIKNLAFDTMIASYLINPQNRRHNLDQLCLAHFEKRKIPIKDLVGKKKQKISMVDVPLEKICEYCCEDVDYTLRLKTLFEKKLEKEHLEKIFYEIELPLLPVLQKMESKGIFLDVHKLKQMSKALQEELKDLEGKIFAETGKEFNIKSPKQLSHILYEHLGLSPSRKKGAQTSTAAHILEELATEAPIVDKILEYRTLEKLRSTYTETLINQVNPYTQRIHCTFNQSIAATGRLSCQDPNLQNIPVKTPRGKKIREGFKPQEKGWVFISFDYSQIELRLLAHFSKDPELVKAFLSQEDIHTHTASIIFHSPLEKITKQQRSIAKTVNFGLLYGQSAFGLSKQLNISTKEAQEFINSYFAKYIDVKRYFTETIEEARKKGFVSTIVGRKRPIPEIHSKNMMIRNAAERLAINTPLQGSNADIIKIAMINIDKEITKQKLQGFCILQIHDELVFEAPEEEIPIFQKLVTEKMEKAVQLEVPLVIDIAIGKNWGEC